MPFGTVSNGTHRDNVDHGIDANVTPSLESTWNTTLEEQMMIMARIEAESQKIKRSKSVSAANFATLSHNDANDDVKSTKYFEETLIPALDVPAEIKVRLLTSL